MSAVAALIHLYKTNCSREPGPCLEVHYRQSLCAPSVQLLSSDTGALLQQQACQ